MFNKNKSKSDGHADECKDCNKLKLIEFKHSQRGVAVTIFDSQNLRSGKRGHDAPTYSKEEFADWLFAQPIFEELFYAWQMSGYETRLKPSADRLDDEKGYSIDNIQLVTWEENNQKEHEKQSVAVNQYSKDGKFIAEHASMCEASRVSGVKQSSISYACSVGRYVSGKYIWLVSKKPVNSIG